MPGTTAPKRRPASLRQKWNWAVNNRKSIAWVAGMALLVVGVSLSRVMFGAFYSDAAVLALRQPAKVAKVKLLTVSRPGPYGENLGFASWQIKVLIEGEQVIVPVLPGKAVLLPRLKEGSMINVVYHRLPGVATVVSDWDIAADAGNR